ncbi:MAG: helix-turn-helix transcriptional regulator, partial [Pleurocapsa sp.]
PSFHCPVGKVTPSMRTIIKQIWEHPYSGAIAQMYLEGKVLELLAMQLAQLAESDLYIVSSALKLKDVDPIYEARDILSQRLENPPSILELAEQVGVSDRTLRRGFSKLFGTTVVGYLNQLRIEQAEILLRTGKLSVAEVANKVGYSHLGHFAAAFKRQFGITPYECLKGKLRD